VLAVQAVLAVGLVVLGLQDKAMQVVVVDLVLAVVVQVVLVALLTQMVMVAQGLHLLFLERNFFTLAAVAVALITQQMDLVL